MSKLTLVVSNPIPVQEACCPSHPITSKEGFTAKVRNRGSCLYEVATQDPFHRLACNLILEVEEACEEKAGGVICHFPTIADGPLEDFVEENELLYGIIMVQFHMKILQQLLLFCTNHYASRLIIYTDDEQAEELGIYEDFLVHQGQTLTTQGEKTEMVIPVNQETCAAWLDFMAETTVKLGQELWREQRSNPIIRNYLKSYALS